MYTGPEPSKYDRVVTIITFVCVLLVFCLCKTFVPELGDGIIVVSLLTAVTVPFIVFGIIGVIKFFKGK